MSDSCSDVRGYGSHAATETNDCYELENVSSSVTDEDDDAFRVHDAHTTGGQVPVSEPKKAMMENDDDDCAASSVVFGFHGLQVPMMVNTRELDVHRRYYDVPRADFEARGVPYQVCDFSCENQSVSEIVASSSFLTGKWVYFSDEQVSQHADESDDRIVLVKKQSRRCTLAKFLKTTPFLRISMASTASVSLRAKEYWKLYNVPSMGVEYIPVEDHNMRFWILEDEHAPDVDPCLSSASCRAANADVLHAWATTSRKELDDRAQNARLSMSGFVHVDGTAHERHGRATIPSLPFLSENALPTIMRLRNVLREARSSSRRIVHAEDEVTLFLLMLQVCVFCGTNREIALEFPTDVTGVVFERDERNAVVKLWLEERILECTYRSPVSNYIFSDKKVGGGSGNGQRRPSLKETHDIDKFRNDFSLACTAFSEGVEACKKHVVLDDDGLPVMWNGEEAPGRSSHGDRRQSPPKLLSFLLARYYSPEKERTWKSKVELEGAQKKTQKQKRDKLNKGLGLTKKPLQR